MINLTPHEIVIDCEDGFDSIKILPSGQVARLEQTIRPLSPIAIGNTQIPVYEFGFGEVFGLPEPDGNVYIVSRMVLDAVKTSREDVYAPGEAIRDASGRIVACKGLSR